jgi:hypothetical protein
MDLMLGVIARGDPLRDPGRDVAIGAGAHAGHRTFYVGCLHPVDRDPSNNSWQTRPESQTRRGIRSSCSLSGGVLSGTARMVEGDAGIGCAARIVVAPTPARSEQCPDSLVVVDCRFSPQMASHDFRDLRLLTLVSRRLPGGLSHAVIQFLKRVASTVSTHKALRDSVFAATYC